MKVRIITENKKKKKNCLSHKEYKTMKGKIKCVMRQKNFKKEKAGAYVAGGLRKSGRLDESSLPHHQILKKPRIMARAYKKYVHCIGSDLENDGDLPKCPVASAQEPMTKEAFLNEIINLAAYTDKFAFIFRSKAWGITDEKTMYEALIENYLVDPFTKSAIDRIKALKVDDLGSDNPDNPKWSQKKQRPEGFYDLPQIDPQDREDLISLIVASDPMDEPEDAFRGEINPDAGTPSDKTWKFGD